MKTGDKHRPGIGRRLRRSIKWHQKLIERHGDEPEAVARYRRAIAETTKLLRQWEAGQH